MFPNWREKINHLYELSKIYQQQGYTHVALYITDGVPCTSGCFLVSSEMRNVGGAATVVEGGSTEQFDWQQPVTSDGIYSPNGTCPPGGCPAFCPPEGCGGSGSTGGTGGTGGTGTGGTGGTETGTGGAGAGGVFVPGGGATGWEGGTGAGEQTAVGGEGKVQKCPQSDGSEVDCPRGRTGMKPVLPSVSATDFYTPRFTNLNNYRLMPVGSCSLR